MAADIIVTVKQDGRRAVVTATQGGTVIFSERCDPTGSPSREKLKAKLAEAIPDADLAAVERLLLALTAQQAPAPVDGADEDPSKPGDAELAKTAPDIVEEARAMLRAPNLVEHIARDLVHAGIVGEHELAVTIYLCGTSRLLPKPCSAIVQGSSSSGKSHVVGTAASLFPPEATLLATDMSKNALYYLPYGELRHKFVVGGERSRMEDDDRAEATRALREMLEAGDLHKSVTTKEGDKLVTRSIHSPGPISFIETTTLATIFEEDKNRCLLLASDDGSEQTRMVVDAIAARYAGNAPADVDRLRQVHHAMQRMLRRVKVLVPFSPQLGRMMPTNRPEARRAIHQVNGLVQAAALLHQFQRHDDPQHGAEIKATIDDYRVARLLLAGPLARSLGSALPEHVLTFARWLQTAKKPGEAFTVGDLEGPDCRWGRSSLYGLVKPLHAVGFLGDAGSKGKADLHRIVGPLPDVAATWLPMPEALL